MNINSQRIVMTALKVFLCLLSFCCFNYTSSLSSEILENHNSHDRYIESPNEYETLASKQDGDADEIFQRQKDEYDAGIPKTVLELQQFRRVNSIGFQNMAGQEGMATLVNLNPSINTWFLLFIQWKGRKSFETYHLENPLPTTQYLFLYPDYSEGLVVESAESDLFPCALWDNDENSEIIKASLSGQAYVPLCEGKLYLRNRTRGHKTNIETATDFLRKHVWQGEKITTFVRKNFYQDTYLNRSELINNNTNSTSARPRLPGAPARPLIDPAYSGYFIIPHELGIEIDCDTGEKIMVGRWYRVTDLPGIFISVIQPGLVSKEITEAQGVKENLLDDVESKALVYIVAFDLDFFDLGFEMGTEHPEVGWSERVPEQVRDKNLPGPDGIDTTEPLVMTGLLNPYSRDRVAATFIGGFKRYHGAFRWPPMALKNNGSHYGFIENGTVLSKLQPGLSTVLVDNKGAVDIKTWSDEYNDNLREICNARQNGVPIIEYDEKHNSSMAGKLVYKWGAGNWSGSVDEKLRTVRSGLGIQVFGDHKFLIYSYFSSATPSAMARVFQAYNCRYAMLLDINALEHTYLAVYRNQQAQHLIKGMGVLDKVRGDKIIHRFVDYADNRDFFYLLKKDNP